MPSNPFPWKSAALARKIVKLKHNTLGDQISNTSGDQTSGFQRFVARFRNFIRIGATAQAQEVVAQEVVEHEASVTQDLNHEAPVTQDLEHEVPVTRQLEDLDLGAVNSDADRSLLLSVWDFGGQVSGWVRVLVHAR